jgi:hypothetical protein
MRVLGFEAWNAGSHRAIGRSLARHGRDQWTWVTLGPGPWRWRQRLGMVELVEQAQKQGALEQPWDCFVCTSLLGVGELRGLLPKALRAVPIVLLVHENQVAYPAGLRGVEPRDIHASVTDLTSMLAADAVVWTSAWNKRSCLEGFFAMLNKHPTSQRSNWLEAIEGKSTVIWPPVEDPRTQPRVEHNWNNSGRSGGRKQPHQERSQLVAWPHRHQHDKGPAALAAIAARYTTPWQLRWALLGERLGPTPAALKRFRVQQGEAIVHDAYCDRGEYLGWLNAADWVCSTAKHEFFGIAVVEALLMGCLPWLPNRLSYPELLPEIARGLNPGMAFDEADRLELSEAIVRHLEPAIAPAATSQFEAIIGDTIATCQGDIEGETSTTAT